MFRNYIDKKCNNVILSKNSLTFEFISKFKIPSHWLVSKWVSHDTFRFSLNVRSLLWTTFIFHSQLLSVSSSNLRLFVILFKLVCFALNHTSLRRCKTHHLQSEAGDSLHGNHDLQCLSLAVIIINRCTIFMSVVTIGNLTPYEQFWWLQLHFYLSTNQLLAT